jgi:hypothetical protein
MISVGWPPHSIFGRFWPVFDRLVISMGCSESGLHRSLQFSFVIISMTYEIIEKIDIYQPLTVIGFS